MAAAREVQTHEPLASFGATQYADLTPDARDRNASTFSVRHASASFYATANTSHLLAAESFTAAEVAHARAASVDWRTKGAVTPGYGDMGCMGGLPSNAYKYVAAKGGLESEADYPLECTLPICGKKCKFDASKVATKITGGIAIKSDEAQMLAWLTKNGPISIGVNAAGSTWQTYKGGIVTNCASKQPDHGVLIVGYGEDGSQPGLLAAG
eukprot:gene10925-18289_t